MPVAVHPAIYFLIQDRDFTVKNPLIREKKLLQRLKNAN